ncbi:MAG: hypothetical protein U0470_02715 [Anaerolineae bacterium]
MFAVIEDEKPLRSRQPVDDAVDRVPPRPFPDAKSGRHRGRHLRLTGQRCELNKADPAEAALRDLGRQACRQPAFADTSQAGERDQPMFGQQPPDRPELRIPPNELRQRRRDRVRPILVRPHRALRLGQGERQQLAAALEPTAQRPLDLAGRVGDGSHRFVVRGEVAEVQYAPRFTLTASGPEVRLKEREFLAARPGPLRRGPASQAVQTVARKSGKKVQEGDPAPGGRVWALVGMDGGGHDVQP